MTKDLTIRNSTAEFLIFQSQVKEETIEVKFADGTVWLSQKMIAKLFDVDRTVITKHLKNIFERNELDEKSNVQKMHFSHSDKPIKFYNLDVIISVVDMDYK